MTSQGTVRAYTLATATSFGALCYFSRGSFCVLSSINENGCACGCKVQPRAVSWLDRLQHFAGVQPHLAVTGRPTGISLLNVSQHAGTRPFSLSLDKIAIMALATPDGKRHKFRQWLSSHGSSRTS